MATASSQFIYSAPTDSSGDVMDSRSEQDRLKREASAFILSFFEAGKNKDLGLR